MSEVPVKVTIRNGTVTIRFPTSLIEPRPADRRRRTVREAQRAFKAVEGILKGRRPDGLKYQHTVRREWD